MYVCMYVCGSGPEGSGFFFADFISMTLDT